mgnify:FL=1
MRPKIYAHRGASRQQRENSIEAFELAAELGADGVELDVRRTLSGELVVHHDAYAEGVLIARADRRALPSHVPDLGDALDACSGLRVNIEIKVDDPHKRESFGLAQEVAQHLRSRAEPVGRWLVSSFDHGVVDHMRELFPELPTGLLSWREPWQGVIRHVVDNGHLAIHPNESMVDGQLVRAAHAAGIEVNTWTVNDPERGIELAELGVDGLITDVPHEMLEVLGHLQ